MRRKNVLAVMSSKGGVGKTVTTANLAVALATEFNKKVLAIDTNITTASLGLHLNILYPKVTIYDLLKNDFSVEDSIHQYHDNLYVIPACIKIKKKEKNLYSVRDNVEKIVEHYDVLLSKLSKEYDLILLDCAPGFDIESIATMHVAGGLLLITNPEYPAIVSAVKSIEYAKFMKIPVGGIVLNKVMNKKYELKDKEIENALQIKIIQKIPFDKKIPESIANRVPVVLFAPYCKSSIAYKKLAASIIGKKYRYSYLSRIKSFFK